MQVTLDALRWRDRPVRATVTSDGGAPRVRLEATTRRAVEAMCAGRPVEELPRILSILSPAHHLCAAQLLDRLFGVEPPPVASNAREALRLALVLVHHGRKLQLLLSSGEAPFSGFRAEGARRGPPGLRRVADDLKRHVAAAKEAAAILGGRADHPLTAVAGGVSRALKPEHRARLGELAGAARRFAEQLADALRAQVLTDGELLREVRALDPGPLASLALAADPDTVVLRDGRGAEVERFAAGALLDKIGVRHEPWSHDPFAFLAGKGREGGDGAPAEAIFLVGPLARLAGGEPLATPLAEAERRRLVEALGALPRFEVVAAYWALLVELVGAAEGLAARCDEEHLAGPALRTIPAAPGREAHATLESPQGLVHQRVRVDGRGVVEELRVLDAVTANNALFGVVAQRALESGRARAAADWDETKRRMELALLAY